MKDKKSHNFHIVFYDDQIERIKKVADQEGFSTISNYVRSTIINHVNSKLKK